MYQTILLRTVEEKVQGMGLQIQWWMRKHPLFLQVGSLILGEAHLAAIHHENR